MTAILQYAIDTLLVEYHLYSSRSSSMLLVVEYSTSTAQERVFLGWERWTKTLLSTSGRPLDEDFTIDLPQRGLYHRPEVDSKMWHLSQPEKKNTFLCLRRRLRQASAWSPISDKSRL